MEICKVALVTHNLAPWSTPCWLPLTTARGAKSCHPAGQFGDGAVYLTDREKQVLFVFPGSNRSCERPRAGACNAASGISGGELAGKPIAGTVGGCG